MYEDQQEYIALGYTTLYVYITIEKNFWVIIVCDRTYKHFTTVLTLTDLWNKFRTYQNLIRHKASVYVVTQWKGG